MLIFSDDTIENNNAEGIWASNINSSAINNNVIFENLGRSIFLYNSFDSNIFQNNISFNILQGIDIVLSTNCTIADNYIHGNSGSYGIQITTQNLI